MGTIPVQEIVWAVALFFAWAHGFNVGGKG